MLLGPAQRSLDFFGVAEAGVRLGLVVSMPGEVESWAGMAPCRNT
jgi:hypothetical protein